MRKHFLLLLWLTLLPLALWAQTITISPNHAFTITYGDETPAVTNRTWVTMTASGGGTGYTGTYGANNTFNGSNTLKDQLLARLSIAQDYSTYDAGTYNYTLTHSGNEQFTFSSGGNTYTYTIVHSGTGTMNINRATNAITSVSLDNWAYGETANTPSVTATNTDGAITYQYYDGGWSSTVPTAVGNYQVRATIAQSTNYNAVTSSGYPFKITKAAVTVTLGNVTREWQSPWTPLTVDDITPVVTGGTTDWNEVKGYLKWNQVEPIGNAGDQYAYTLDPNGTSDNYNITVSGAGAVVVEKNTTGSVAGGGNATLTYTGEAQNLNPSTALAFRDGKNNEAGTVQYKITAPAAAVTDWSDAVPTATNAGTYTIVYKGVGDQNHTDSEDAAYTYDVTINPYVLVAGTDFTAPTAKTDGVYSGSAQDIAIPGEFIGKFAEELATAGAKFIYPTADALPQQTNANDNYSFSWDIDLGTSTNFSYTAGATTVTGAKIAKAFITSADYTLPEAVPDLVYNAGNLTLHTALGWNVTPAPGEAHYNRSDVTDWPTTLRYRNIAGNWIISTAIVPDDNHTFEAGSYISTVTIGGQTGYIVQNDLEVSIAKADLTITNPGSVVTTNVFDGTAQGLVATAPTFSGPGAANVGGTVTYAWNDGENDQTATNLANVVATNAGEYAITYTFVPTSNNFNAITEAKPLGGDDAKAIIDQFTLYVGGNEVTGTIEDVVDLETGTPKISMADFLPVDKVKAQLPAADASADVAAILNQLVAPAGDITAIIANAKLNTNPIALQKVDVAPAPGAPMNYKVDEATLLSNSASLTLSAIEAAIQTAPEGYADGDLTYNGADQKLVKTAAVGYKAMGGAGTVAIGKVVYSLTGEDGSWTDVDPTTDATTIVGKDADEYTVYYKVELDNSDEATNLDRFYEYTAGVKSFNVTIAQKDLADEMFVLTPTEAVYNGNNQLPVITTKEGEPIVDADYYFEFADGDGNPIADPNTGVKDVDDYAITFIAEADGNYKGTASATWKITKKELADEMFILSANVEFNGAAQKPTITTKDGEPIVAADYTIEVKDGEGNLADIDNLVNVDEYTFNFIATADGNYQGLASAKWQITAKPLTADMFVFTDGVIFNGTAQKPTITTKEGEPIVAADYTYAITDGEDAAIEETALIDADTYTYTFTAVDGGNYSGEVTVDWTIAQATATIVEPTKINLTYNGKNQILVTEATSDAVAGSEGQAGAKIEYKVTFGEDVIETEDITEVVGKNAGAYTVEYSITASDKNYTNPNITGTVEGTEILKATIGYMLGGMTKVWDGEAITQEANAEQLEKVFTIFAGELFEDDIYDVPFTLALPEDYRDAGEHTFSAAQAEEGVQFKEGYPVNYKINFTGTGSVMIKKADIADGDYTAPAAVAEDLTYINGTAQALVTAGEVTAKTAEDYPNTEIAGKPFGTIMYASAEDGEYAETAPTGTDAGDYEVWYYVKGDINHNDTKPVKIEKSIAPKAMTFALAFEDAEVEYTGNDNMPADIVAYDGEIALTEADYALTINGEAVTEETKLVNAGIYEFAYTGKGNYEGSSAAATITVGKAPLTAEMIPAYTESVTYDGKDHKFELALEAEGLTTADYTTAATEGDWINAGEYTFTFTAAEDGNYSGEIEAIFTIDRKEVIAQAADATKVYDGEEGFAELPVMTYLGLVPGEEDSFATDGAFTIEESSANVGTYTFTIDPTKLIAEPNNYEVTAANGGTFTITPAPLMVNWNTEAEPFSKEYGAEDPELNPEGKLSITGAIAGEEDAIIAGTVITRAEGEEVGKYAVTLAADPDAEVFANYDVEFTGYAEAFVIEAATVKISIAALNKVYDAKPATIEVKAKDLIVTGLKNGDKVEDIFTTLPTATVADGNAINVGDYEVTLAGAVAGDYEFEYIPSSFKITPATITAATIAEQKVQQGKELDETAFTIEGVAEGDEEYFYITSEYADMNGVVTGAAGTYKGALVIGIADDVIDNYTGYDAFSGDLVIISAEAVVLADNATFTSEEVQEGVTVTFGDRKINAGTWNVCALPFAASVAQISEAFGYAAVDVLNETSADGNIHFNLISSGEVPAYTPFIVKTTEDADLVKTNFNQVVFYDVTIEKSTGENKYVEDAAKNKFWGTFQETTTFHGQEFWYMSKGEWKDARNYTDANPVKLKPFRAYIEFDPANVAAGARVFVEEPDGTVTAIDAATFNKEINEGVYNLNGMKVNNANRKGVYIQNGKKVVK